MSQYSYVNEFVVFPSKTMEDQWEQTPRPHLAHNDLAKKFEELLDTATSEQELHEFFEMYPQLLPDIEHYHNGPRGDLVVTKLPLGENFVTDFAFVTENSQMVQFTCIEIESPRKRIFNKDGTFTREYVNAKQQITDWNLWAQQNVKQVMRMFGRLGNWLPEKYYKISLECILIIGRRSEINTVKRKQRWAAEYALRQASLNMMTYDRLLERMRCGVDSWTGKMLVCTYRDRAVHVKRISA